MSFDPIINGKLNKHIRECESGGGSGGGLPAVELETVITTTDGPANGILSQVDGQKLEATLETESPVAVKVTVDSTQYVHVFTKCSDFSNGDKFYSALIPTLGGLNIFIFGRMATGAWIYQVDLVGG